jgi:hypothetical protein
MADVKISALPASTTPLDGTEVLPIVQGTTTKQVSITNVTAGRAVAALNISTSGSTSTTPVLGFNASNTNLALGGTISGSYLQAVMQNKSGTAGASTNFAISNDLGTDSTYYGEFGMNSSVFSASTPADYFSINNGIYFSGHDGDVSIGSGNGFKTYLAWGTTGQSAHVINVTGALGLSTNLGTTPALSGTTGYGTSGNVLVSQGSSSASVWSTSVDILVNGVTVGKGAGSASTSTAVGVGALASNVSGGGITAVGYNALNKVTAATNGAFGNLALAALTTGANNICVGTQSGQSLVTASGVTFIGVNSGQSSVATGNAYNTYVGFQAGIGAAGSTGKSNTFVGANAGWGLTTGSNNTFVGPFPTDSTGSGFYVTSGSNNVILGGYNGQSAPISATGSNFVVLSDGQGNIRQYFNGSIAIFNGTISPVQAATASAPAYVKGAIYFDTTLNKLRVGGATAWETITSA